MQGDGNGISVFILRLLLVQSAIPLDIIRSQAETGRHNRLLWVDAETSIAAITREFVALCLEQQDGDSAAA